jgi:arylesterase / paraoxonase
MRRYVLASAVIVVLFGFGSGAWWLERYHWSGGFRDVHPHFSGTCELIQGVPSPEDLAVDPTTGIAYLSSYDRGAAARGESVAGAILAFNLNHPSPEPIPLETDITNFRPHGVSLLRASDGARRLFVINHGREGGSVVEVFRIAADELVHVRTIAGEHLVSPNNIVAVADDMFYVTNSRRYTSGLRAWIEDIFRMRWGSVLYFDGTSFSEVVLRHRFPKRHRHRSPSRGDLCRLVLWAERPCLPAQWRDRRADDR